MRPRQPDPAPADSGEKRLLLAIILIGALLRLFHLGYQSLWVDEIFTLEVATPKPGYPIWQLLRHNVHGPLHTFVVFLFRSLSEGDAWLRLPSAIAGTVSIPLMYAWLRPRFGARTAQWGALLLAVNPLHVHYSQELRNYAFAVCFVLAGCVQLDRVVVAWSRRGALLLSMLVAAALLSNFSAAFAFLAQTGTWFRGSGLSRRSVARWVAVVAATAVLISPWIYRVHTYVDVSRLVTPVMPGEIESQERLRGETTFRFESAPYAAFAYSVGLSLGPSLRDLHGDASLASVVRHHAGTIAIVAVAFGGVFLAGVTAVRRRRGWGGVAEMVAYVLIPLGATLLLNWQNAKAFNVRYVIVGLPAFLAFLAAGIAASGRWRPWVAAAVLSLSVASLANHYFNPAFAKEDVKRAVREVERRIAPGECVFAPTVWQVVEHYLTIDAPVHYVYSNPPGLAARQLEEMFSACESFWYLRSRPWVDDADGRVQAEIDSRCETLDRFELPGVEVTRYRVVSQ